MNISKYILYTGIILMAISCVDAFNPPSTNVDISLLVINSQLNATDSTCTVSLTRSVPISGSNNFPKVPHATITLEEKNGNQFNLTEKEPGQYIISKLTLASDKQYRLKITDNKDEYVSEYVNIIQTPPIDSISYKQVRTGMQINASTHDEHTNTHYYLWQFTETWEYNSHYFSNVKLVNGEIVEKDLDELNYICWRTRPSSSIIVASSTKLQKDIISEHQIQLIPWTSPMLERKYSILVEQYGITPEAYEYWQLLEKNTENIGTLFDPLPSKVNGNFICTTSPDFTPLGFFKASTVQKQRIFISRQNVNRPHGIDVITGYEDCHVDSIRGYPPTSLNGEMLIGPYYKSGGLGPGGALVAPESCVDCRSKGGTTQPPDFWK